MSILSITSPPSGPTPVRAVPRPEAPRPGYLELKGNIHRKLLNRLNLEALASADRARRIGDPDPAVRADCRRGHAAQHDRAGGVLFRRHRRGLRPRAAGAAAA